MDRDYFREPFDIPRLDSVEPVGDAQHAAVLALRQLIETTEDQPAAVLVGPPGTGKTMLAASVMEQQQYTGPKYSAEAMRSEYVFASWPRLLRDLRFEKTWWRDERFTTAVEAGLIVVDDLAAPRDAQEVEIFSTLIEERYAWTKACGLFVTSNLAPPQMLDAFGARTYDRLRDDVLWLVLDGQSLRRPQSAKSLAALCAEIAADPGDEA